MAKKKVVTKSTEPDALRDTSNDIEVRLDDLTDEQRSHLSKALFPETHTDTVTLLGEERTLRPTPIKVSKKLQALVSPLSEKLDDDNVSPVGTRRDEEMLGTLFKIAGCLAEFYGWDDVAAAAKDEELSNIELESLAHSQLELNGANDFFLHPLRVLVSMLQAREIALAATTGLQNMSITLPFSSSGDVLSTS